MNFVTRFIIEGPALQWAFPQWERGRPRPQQSPNGKVDLAADEAVRAPIPSARMIPLVAGVLLGLAAPLSSFGQAVDVTVRLDDSSIAVGQTTTLRVYAQIKEALRPVSNRIFSWHVDLFTLNDSIAVVEGEVAKTSSDQFAFPLSSSGLDQGVGRIGIYDTFSQEAGEGAGRDAPIELFHVAVRGLAAGGVIFQVLGGSAVNLAADFIVAPTGGGDPFLGGDYTNASAELVIGDSGVACQTAIRIEQALKTADVTSVILSYDLCPGKDHFVEFKNDLGSSPWSPLPGGPHNEGLVVDNSSVELKYYRVRLADRGSVACQTAITVEQAVKTGNDTSVILTFDLCPGKNHFVEFKDDLGSSQWTPLLGGPHNEGLAVDTAAVNQRYYRVRIAN